MKIVIILIVVGLLIGGGWFVLQKNTRPGYPPPTPPETTERLGAEVTDEDNSPETRDTPPTDDTAGWETYRNEEYGFEFEYPPDWEVQELGTYEIEGDSHVVVIPIGEEVPLRIETINVGRESVFDPALPLAGGIKDTKFAGRAAKQDICEWCITDRYLRNIRITEIQDIPWEEFNEIWYEVNRQTEYLIPTFDQILSTFKFIE